ncbi:4409_t:CDS:2, partial [Funneliformis mosseae]
MTYVASSSSAFYQFSTSTCDIFSVRRSQRHRKWIEEKQQSGGSRAYYFLGEALSRRLDHKKVNEEHEAQIMVNEEVREQLPKEIRVRERPSSIEKFADGEIDHPRK